MSLEAPQDLLVRDGELHYLPGFLQASEQAEWFQRLSAGLDWQEEEIVIAGKRLKVPRRVCWYGTPEAIYRYSGVSHQPLPWSDDLLVLKQRIEAACGRHFNSVLANLYRDGNDSIGWHADKERELGENPFIASLSLGEERLFRLRHIRTGDTVNLPLAGGSLLLMGGSLQHHWRHCIPKTRAAKSARINLTFRTVLSAKPADRKNLPSDLITAFQNV